MLINERMTYNPLFFICARHHECQLSSCLVKLCSFATKIVSKTTDIRSSRVREPAAISEPAVALAEVPARCAPNHSRLEQLSTGVTGTSATTTTFTAVMLVV